MYQYKMTFNMTAEESKAFAANPHEWFQTQLKEAVKHDPLIATCYYTYLELHESCEDPFEQVDFLTFLAYQALLSNSINLEQLTQISKIIVMPTISMS